MTEPTKHTTSRQNLAANVRTRRQKLGLSCGEVGRRMGLQGQAAMDYCSRLERGKRGISLEGLDQLAGVLKTTASRLLRVVQPAVE